MRKKRLSRKKSLTKKQNLRKKRLPSIKDFKMKMNGHLANIKKKMSLKKSPRKKTCS